LELWLPSQRSGTLSTHLMSVQVRGGSKDIVRGEQTPFLDSPRFRYRSDPSLLPCNRKILCLTSVHRASRMLGSQEMLSEHGQCSQKRCEGCHNLSSSQRECHICNGQNVLVPWNLMLRLLAYAVFEQSVCAHFMASSSSPEERSFCSLIDRSAIFSVIQSSRIASSTSS
jgi:hypothetical protein